MTPEPARGLSANGEDGDYMETQWILSPFFIGEPLPGLESLAGFDWILNRPTLMPGTKQERMSVHRPRSESTFDLTSESTLDPTSESTFDPRFKRMSPRRQVPAGFAYSAG